MSIIGSELLLGAEDGGYTVERSLRVSGGAKINRTPSAASNRKTWTLSLWVKRARIRDAYLLYAGTTGGTPYTNFYITTVGQLWFNPTNTIAVYPANSAHPCADTNNWYHIVLAVDTTQAVQANRVKMYVNGDQITLINNTTLNLDTYINSTYLHELAEYSANDIYYADYHLIDGQALTASDFAEADLNGLWVPKQYTGSYGTNGFYLDFSDNSSAANLVADKSGNGNNFTPTGINVTPGHISDSFVDSPSVGTQTDTGSGGQVSANYCILENTNRYNPGTNIDDGALKIQHDYLSVRSYTGTVSFQSGKYYWEIYVNQAPDTAGVGIAESTVAFQISGAYYNGSGSTVCYLTNGNKVINGSFSAYGSSWGTAGDIIGVAVDADAGTITFYKNGVSQGTAATGLVGRHYPAFLMNKSAGNSSVYVNFGQRPYSYPVSGYKALCSTNINESILTPQSYFDSATYTGNGSTQVISSLQFNPSVVWIKSRNNAQAPIGFDIARGAGNYVTLNNNSVQTLDSNSLTSFNSNGFTLGSSLGNYSGWTYVGWSWGISGSPVTNNDGTITSTVRANPSIGASIVTYAGGTTGTVGHGLGVAPDFIISKVYTGTSDSGIVYQATAPLMGRNSYLRISSTSSYTTNTSVWGTSAPDSSVFGVKAFQSNSLSGSQHVAYCFSAVPGFSQFGWYSGGGSNVFNLVINTGFAPAFVMIKSVNNTSNWAIVDRKRDEVNNVSSRVLVLNTTGAETLPNSELVWMCNGFKLKTNNVDFNLNGAQYIYMAFAYNPFSLSRAQGILT